MRLRSDSAIAPLALAFSACWSPSPAPAPLADCVGTAAHPCTVDTVGGAKGNAAPDAGDAADDAEDLDAGLDAGAPGACGAAASLLARQTPACAQCVAAGPDAGPATCCGLESICSADPACLTVLQCELTSSCGNLPVQGAPAYNVLAQCINSTCSLSCPPLPTVPVGDP